MLKALSKPLCQAMSTTFRCINLSLRVNSLDAHGPLEEKRDGNILVSTAVARRCYFIVKHIDSLTSSLHSIIIMISMRLPCAVHLVKRWSFFSTVSVRWLSPLSSVQTHGTSLLQPQATGALQLSQRRYKLLFVTKPRKFRPRHSKDGVHPDMILIYENNMNRYHLWSQLIINLLGVPSSALCIYNIASKWHLQDFSITSPVIVSVAYLSFYSFLLFGVNLLAHRSIRRMYADKEAKQFIAVVQDWKMFPTLIDFDMSTVAKREPGNFMGYFLGNLKINNRSYLVSPSDFLQPYYFNMFMGYDLHRPLDKVDDIDLKDIFRELQNKSKQDKMK